MPFQPALPTWLAINNMNSPYQSGQGDSLTGFPYNAGGLNAGDYFDLTNDEAANASYTTNGTLYSGRYRYVLVDSGATASNVKTGTVGFIRVGGALGNVRTVVITNAGTGATAGTYNIAANIASGGGTGAIIQVVVGSGGTITSATVLNGGSGYISAPTFSLTSTGTSAGAVVAQLNTSPNIVTSADQVGVTAIAVRPVVFLNSITPGNFGFIQELGTATVLNAASTVQTAGQFAIVTTSTGIMTASATTITDATIGLVIDPVASVTAANVPFKIQMGYAAMVLQD